MVQIPDRDQMKMDKNKGNWTYVPYRKYIFVMLDILYWKQLYSRTFEYIHHQLIKQKKKQQKYNINVG